MRVKEGGVWSVVLLSCVSRVQYVLVTCGDCAMWKTEGSSVCMLWVKNTVEEGR